MDKKTKKNVMIMLLIVVILIIGLVLFNLFNPKSSIERRMHKVNREDELSSKILLPTNFGISLSTYTGEVQPEVIGKEMNYIAAEMIPKYYKICKNYSIEEIENYYNRNSEMIEAETGFTTYVEFRSFINKICVFDTDEIQLLKYEIVPDSYRPIGRKLVGYIKIYYDETQELVFKYIVSDVVYGTKHSVLLSNNVDMDELESIYETTKKREAQTANEYVVESTGRVY